MTNGVYLRRRMSLLGTGQSHPNNVYIRHQHVTLETMCLHSRDQSKTRKLIRFYIIVILSENKPKYLHCSIVYNV